MALAGNKGQKLMGAGRLIAVGYRMAVIGERAFDQPVAPAVCRLAAGVRAPDLLHGNLRRSPPVSRDMLSGGKLGRCPGPRHEPAGWPLSSSCGREQAVVLGNKRSLWGTDGRSRE